MKKRKYFYIIRHGETIWNFADLLQGRKDIPLSDLGMDQAREKAYFFRDKDLAYIGTSPLLRTEQTAEIISSELNIPKITFDELLARNYGIWEGKKISEIKTENKELCNELKKWPLDQIFKIAPHNSIESYKIVSDRIFNLLRSLAKREGNALLVTHGGVITALLLFFKISTFELPIISHEGYVKLCFDDQQFIPEKVEGLIIPSKKKNHERVFVF